MDHFAKQSKTVIWLLSLMTMLIACSVTDETTNQTVTRASTISVVETVAATNVPATATPRPTSEPRPSVTVLTPTPTVEPTIEPSPTIVPAPTLERTLVDTPIFTGGDLGFRGWSPDGRYLTYFEYTEEQVAQGEHGIPGTYPGTFVIYDTQTGEKCTDYPLNGRFPYEGGEAGPPWKWLPDGRLLIQVPDRPLEVTDAPCKAGDPTAITSISSIETFSPNLQKLLLVREGQYFIYDWMSDTFVTIPEIEPTHFNNLIWSPDSRHISVTLAGNYTGNRAPIGGSRVIDVASGLIVARHDWEPINAIDGTFGGPVWLDNETFVVTISLDQGPFFMRVDGEVSPVLPLFNTTFERENAWPPLDVYSEVENERYAMLHTDGFSGRMQLLIATNAGETVEQLVDPFYFQLYPDGQLGYQADDGRFRTRAVFDSDAPFTEQPATYDPWSDAETSLTVLVDETSVVLMDAAPQAAVKRFQFAGYESGFHLWANLSPDSGWIAVFVSDPQNGMRRALFVVPTTP